MSVTPLSFPDFIDTTADEQRWQILNSINGGNGTPVNVQDHNSGVNGGTIVAATGSATGNFYALQFVTSGTLTAYTGNLTGTVTGVTFPAGFVLYGTTTAFTTGSGTAVVAYSL
jgi:hypothetical protein